MDASHWLSEVRGTFNCTRYQICSNLQPLYTTTTITIRPANMHEMFLALLKTVLNRSCRSTGTLLNILLYMVYFQINGVSVTGLTRQEVVKRLVSIPHTVELLLANKQTEYSELFTNSDTLSGDEFYIKTNVLYTPIKAEKDLKLTMRPGDVFKVIDTLPENSAGRGIS